MLSLLQNLPQGWEVKTLGEIFLIERGGSPRPIKEYLTDDESGINWIKIGDTKDISKYIFTTTQKIKLEGKKYSRFVEVGDLILSNSMSFGKPYIMKTTGCIHDGWVVLRQSKKVIDEEFAYYILISNEIYAEFNRLATGSTVKNLNIDRIKQIQIPLPPLETQKAIVEKLENAFAHIDEAVHHLKVIQTNIPRLKSSLLHCAFSGKLTESQNQLREVQTLKSVVGVEGEFEREEGATSRSFRKKLAQTCTFKPLRPLIKAEVPQDWEIKTLGEVAKIKGGKRIPKGSKYADIPTQYPYIRVTDFENMSVNTKNLKYLTDEIQEKIKNYTISKDDVYISIAGSIGKVGIIPDELDKANLTENAAKIIHSMNKKYLAFYLNSNEIQSQISFLTKATTQPKLALNRIENLIIKIPPIETQKQIVQILESKFAHLEKLAQFVNASLENLQRLKSSLLNQAFKGELV